MQFFHPVLIGFYLVLPLAAATTAGLTARRTKSRKPIRDFTATCISALVLSVGFNAVYAYQTRCTVRVGQVLLTAYFGIAVLVVLKAFSRGLKISMSWLFRVNAKATPEKPHGWNWAVRAASAIMIQVVLLFGLGLPYIMAVGMIYRTKVTGGEDPKEQLHADFQSVQFESTDGIRLSGWWIPAQPEPTTRTSFTSSTQPTHRDWGRKTVILCHGLGAGKANQLLMVRELFDDGYNVLVFDFRAHGDSGGQLMSFGDRERYDVLGAVRWLRENHPAECKRLYGLGASMGGAALIAAAADDSPEGRAFDAIAVYSTFDRFDTLADDVAKQMFPPLGWLAEHVGLPLMSLHAGADLHSFAPAILVDRVAPRPLLVVHGRGDMLVPIESAMKLYDHASMPKLRLWIGKWDKNANEENGAFLNRSHMPADHEGIMFDDDAAHAVHLLFEEMKPLL
jgi:fermentation-respiration switch protein FrsA (DUF1100 family)